MPLVEFSNVFDEHQDSIGEFLESMGLDPNLNSSSILTKDLDVNSKFNLFGIRANIPSNLINAKKWKCSLIKEDGITKFYINDDALAFEIESEINYNLLANQNISQVIVLSLKNLSITDLTILNKFSNSLLAVTSENAMFPPELLTATVLPVARSVPAIIP